MSQEQKLKYVPPSSVFQRIQKRNQELAAIQGKSGQLETTVATPKKLGLPRKVFWRSSSGKWVVVQGPFPDSFFRSETRDTPEKAAKLLVQDIYNRGPTTKEDQFAKCLASDILEIAGGENEFGTVSP